MPCYIQTLTNNKQNGSQQTSQHKYGHVLSHTIQFLIFPALSSFSPLSSTSSLSATVLHRIASNFDCLFGPTLTSNNNSAHPITETIRQMAIYVRVPNVRQVASS